MRPALFAVLLWLAAACACAAQQTHADNAADAQRQVLVLLNLPPAHFRPDAGYSAGYGGGMGRAARHALAARLAREHGLALATDWPMPLLGVDCYVMTLSPDQRADRTPQNVAAALARDTRVVWAQPMNLYRTRGTAADSAPAHNDPLYPAQPAARAWRLAELHEFATGRGVNVAVVDSGVELTHPDLVGQVTQAENFVEGRAYAAERHGTAVAGIIGARADNGIGIAGIAPHATLMALRACWEESPDSSVCTSLSLAKALHFAITHRAEVVNLSLSGPNDRLLGLLIDTAVSHGITVVAPTDPTQPDGGFPASHTGVWAVTDGNDARRQVLHAPGRDTPTTVPGGGWQLVNGASYAAAHIAGLAALLHELGGMPTAVPIREVFVLLPSGDIDTCATLLRVAAARVSSCAAEASRAAAATTVRLRQP